MKKTITILTVSTLLLALCFSAQAQQQTKLPRIGWLGALSLASDAGRELLGREIRALGYVDGKNIVIEYRYAGDKLDRLPALADELVRLKVDVILATATPVALAAKNATTTIPIIFLNVPDPVEAGLVDTLARPGGNITGVTTIAAVLAGKRLELLKETVPKLSRVAVLWDPQDPGSALQWKESQLPARDLSLQIHSLRVSSAEQYEEAFKEAVKARNTAIAVAGSPLALSNQKHIADLAVKNRLPAIASRSDFATSGGLMSYGGDRTEPYRRVASMVDKILKGRKAAELPVEQPTKFEFVINLKTANQIGLTIPPNVLARADRVIK